MKKIILNSGQANRVKNMHLWCFCLFIWFFLPGEKMSLSFRISVRQKEAIVEFCIFILSGCWKKQTKIVSNTFGSLGNNWEFWKILIAINPYKIETMSVLFIKLLCLLQKWPQTQSVIREPSHLQLCWNNYRVCILQRSYLANPQ